MELKLENSPRESAGFFSRLFFWWITPLFCKGMKRTLGVEDLYKVLDDDRSIPLGDRLEIAWEDEVERCRNSGASRKTPSLFKVLWKLFGPQYLALAALVGFGELIVQIAQPICLGLLIRSVEKGEDLKSNSALRLIGGLILASIMYPITNHTYFFQTQRQGMQIRIACSSLIYRKALQMNLGSLRKATAGQIVNLLSNDVNRFDQFLTYLHFIWVAPIQVAVVVCILWTYFGIYCLTGISVLVLFAPLQGVMGKLFGKLRSKAATRTDTRLRILNEVISAIQIIKMQAWEPLFSSKIIEARRDEISRIKKTAMLRAINLTLHNISSKLIVFITLLVYVLMGHQLNAEKVFVTIAFYNSVRRVFTYCVPLAVSNWAEVKISIKRIQEFLINSENDRVRVPIRTLKSNVQDSFMGLEYSESKIAISMTNFSASWEPSASKNTLNNITVDIPTRSLVAVVGKSGTSGKSSFLQGILGELTSSSGKLSVKGTVSYAPQESWIFEGTVRENILFGQDMNIKWYNKVVNACALKRDLALLPLGDQTLVGYKGSSLSGGQRARINLARAVYSKSDIILLDDPLSAVDTQVANHIFRECFLNVLRDRTCILVTHQVQFLPATDKVIVLENGSIQHFGYYLNLVSESVNFATLGSKSDNENEDEKDISTAMIVPKPRKTRIMSTTSEVNIEEWNMVIEDDEDDDILVLNSEDNAAKKPDEAASAYSRSRGLYWKYVRAGTGYCGMILFTILNLIAQILYTGSDYWLQIWVKSESGISNSTLKDDSKSTHNILQNFIRMIQNEQFMDISIYSILFVGLVIVSLIRTLYYFKICMTSSINLHNKIFAKVLSAPLQFFQKNPPGRILNVFSKDVGIVDELLPATLFEAIEAALNVSGVLVVVSIINPILLAPSIVLVGLFFFVRHLYIGTARNIKRLEGSTKSPVFSHMSSSLNGLVIIRAFKAEKDLRNKFDSHQDLHTSAWFLVLSTTRWLAFIVESISVMFISCVTLSFVFFGLQGPAMGLAISSAMTLSAMFQWGVRQSAEAESQLISVERVSQYSKIETEPVTKSQIEHQSVDPSWPSQGSVSFENVTVTFESGTSCNKPVLSNLNFKIAAGEKIGVVGRTGAGKSTLVSTLFRLVDPAQGNIQIDEQCISNIDLPKLRSKISIIPQEPLLFTGSLRQNLDPEGKHTDGDIWGAIKNANLCKILQNIPGGLDFLVVDKGSNFSVGEKQLFCLARALLQQNKILVLDEATASLDQRTDEAIQQTIRDNFSDCTTISIAHRLDTIIDCDRVLVLDAGRVMEFESPYTLLSRNCSYFYKMVEEQGETASKSLFQRAQKVEEGKNSVNL